MTRYLQSPLKWGLSSPLFCCFFIFFSFCPFALLHPGSLSAMRFVAAVQEQEKGGDQQVEQLSRELWRRIWSEDKDITEPGSLSEVPNWTWIVFKEIINHCIDFSENCCCYAGSVESGVAWWWDQETAEAGHLGRDQGKAEEEHTRSTWLWGKLFFCSDNMHTSQIVLFFTFSDSDSLVTTKPSWWDFFSVQLGTGSNVSKQHISTCRYKKIHSDKNKGHASPHPLSLNVQSSGWWLQLQ